VLGLSRWITVLRRPRAVNVPEGYVRCSPGCRTWLPLGSGPKDSPVAVHRATCASFWRVYPFQRRALRP